MPECINKWNIRRPNRVDRHSFQIEKKAFSRKSPYTTFQEVVFMEEYPYILNSTSHTSFFIFSLNNIGALFHKAVSQGVYHRLVLAFDQICVPHGHLDILMPEEIPYIKQGFSMDSEP